MNPTAKSFAISSPMALRFSSSKGCRRCFTGLEPSLIFKVCSVTSLGMPSMSEGFNVKMSLLARRKSTSVLSYSEESALIDFIHANRDIFAWKPSDMPGIPREVTKHALKIRLGSKLVK